MMSALARVTTCATLVASVLAANPSFETVELDGAVEVGYGVAVADADGDGRPDVLLADRRHFFWYRNPTWEKHTLTGQLTPHDHVCIAAADVDGDGRQDIVTGGGWYRNSGRNAGPWERRTIGPDTNNMAAVADFDGDGRVDILATAGQGSESDARLLVAHNAGGGEFRVFGPVAEGEGDFLQGVAVGRFDAGGPLQIALSWHKTGKGIQMVTVPRDPAQQAWPFTRVSPRSQDEQLSAGDIDRDGDLDLLLGTVWLRNDGGGHWTPFELARGRGDPDRNRLADIDGDGRLDAIVGFEAVSVPGDVVWYDQPEDPTGIWAEHKIATVVGPMSLDVADMDGDTDLDVVVGEHNLLHPERARLLVFENLDGRGQSWREHLVWTGDEHHDGAQVVDIDGDGDLDIISIGWGHKQVLLYENHGRRCGLRREPGGEALPSRPPRSSVSPTREMLPVRR
jgi:hypothetical protein